MKKLVSFLLMTLCFVDYARGAVIGYAPSEGMFGDQLVNYAHARYAAYKYNLPLNYIPFDYCDKLQVHTMHRFIEEEDFERIIYCKELPNNNLDSIIEFDKNFLYIIPYFPESPDELARMPFWRFDIDWEDQTFLDIFRREISPIVPINKLNLPKDRITVAVHMRRGGGRDKVLQFGDANYDPTAFYADKLVLSEIPTIRILCNSAKELI